MLRPFVEMICPASKDAHMFQRIGYPNDRLCGDGGPVFCAEDGRAMEALISLVCIF